MFILKRLIIKEWYKFFGSSTLVLFMLITVAELISGFLRATVTPQEVILNHILELPSAFTKIFPIACLVASLFCVNKLKNRNELTAIFAAGYSRKKFVWNLAQAAIGVAVIQLFIASYVQPFAKKQRHLISDGEAKFSNLQSEGLSSSTIASGKIWFKSGDYFFAYTAFDKANNALKGVSIYYLDEHYMLRQRIEARGMSYKKDKLWELSGPKFYNNLSDDKFPIVTKDEFTTLEINQLPIDFMQIEADITVLDLLNLYRYIRKLRDSGINTSEYEVIFYDKIVSSLVCIIFALLSATAIFNPNRRSSSFGKNVIFVFVFTIFYWLIYSYLFELGKSSKINPALGLFAVPASFCLFLGYYFYKNRRLAS